MNTEMKLPEFELVLPHEFELVFKCKHCPRKYDPVSDVVPPYCPCGDLDAWSIQLVPRSWAANLMLERHDPPEVPSIHRVFARLQPFLA